MRIAVLLLALLVTVFALPLPSDVFDDDADADSDPIASDVDLTPGQEEEDREKDAPRLKYDTQKTEEGVAPVAGEEGEDPDATFPNVEKDAEPVADEDEVDGDDLQGENADEVAGVTRKEERDEAASDLAVGKEGETDEPEPAQDEKGEDGDDNEESEDVEV